MEAMHIRSIRIGVSDMDAKPHPIGRIMAADARGGTETVELDHMLAPTGTLVHRDDIASFLRALADDYGMLAKNALRLAADRIEQLGV